MSIPKLAKSKTGNYYIHYHDGRRSQRVSTKTPHLHLAEQAFATWLARRGKILRPVSEITIEDAWNAYFHKHIIPCTRSELSAATVWKNLRPHFGHIKVCNLMERDFDMFYFQRQIRDEAATGTIRKEIQMLQACLRFNRFDVPDIKLPAPSDPRSRWLTTDEISKLTAYLAGARYANNHMLPVELFVWIALETAARRGAIQELTWKNVDFDDGVIRFNDPADTPKNAVRTTKRRADVPMSDTLRKVLTRAKNELLERGCLATGDRLVVGSYDFNSSLKTHALHAGLGSEVTPHTLRHTAATHMARNGVPLWKIAKILGNSMHMVESVYAKWAPDDPDNSVNNITGGKVALL